MKLPWGRYRQRLLPRLQISNDRESCVLSIFRQSNELVKKCKHRHQNRSQLIQIPWIMAEFLCLIVKMHASTYMDFRINKTNMCSYVVCITSSTMCLEIQCERHYGNSNWHAVHRLHASSLHGAGRDRQPRPSGATKAGRNPQKNKGCWCIWPRTQLLHSSGLGFGFDCSCIFQHALRRVLAPAYIHGPHH